MAPQNLNMELLLTSQLAATIDHSKLILKEDYAKLASDKSNKPLSRVGTRFASTDVERRRKKKRFQHFKTLSIQPFNVIQSLLTPGISAASCNEETLSSSFLLLDGILTISLGELSNVDIGSEEFGVDDKYDLLKDSSERWGARMETNISVGKVCYEYQHESEEAEEKCMSNSSSDLEDEQTPHGAILSQKLDIVPLVLDDPSTLDARSPNPDRYVPPSHKMVADCLKVSLFSMYLWNMLYGLTFYACNLMINSCYIIIFTQS